MRAQKRENGSFRGHGLPMLSPKGKARRDDDVKGANAPRSEKPARDGMEREKREGRSEEDNLNINTFRLLKIISLSSALLLLLLHGMNSD